MRAFNSFTFHFACIFVALFYSCNNEPYEGPVIPDTQISCSIASNLADTGLTDFLNSESNNFKENCLAYKAALEQQLLSCPELSDQIVELIDNLNNCELNSFFKADFDDDTYLALSAEARISDGQLIITGRRDTEEFKFILHETTEGTYQLGVTDTQGNINMATYSPDITTNESWVSNNNDGIETLGEVTISEINYSELKISGTFSFTGFNNNETKPFTNGVFIDIPLTKDDEFFALYDGEEYIESSILGLPIENDMTIAIIIFSELDSTNMDFSIDANTPPGFYSLRRIPELPRAGFTANDDFYYYANGTLTITAHNIDAKFIMGTFEFIAELENATPESYTITEGRFCINYGL